MDRIDIENRNGVEIIIKNLRRGIAANDLAEFTVYHGVGCWRYQVQEREYSTKI